MAEQREPQPGFDRVVFFSDAVVAIAATLLILPLVEAATDMEERSVGDLLSDESQQLFAFALSFLVIGRFWKAHHAMFNRVVGVNKALVNANFVWLFGVVFLPFPTELLGSAPSGPDVSALYIGTLAVMTAASAAMQWIIVRSPSIQREEVRGTLTPWGSVTLAGAVLLALIIAVTIPSIGMWSLLLLFAASFVPTPGGAKPASS